MHKHAIYKNTYMQTVFLLNVIKINKIQHFHSPLRNLLLYYELKYFFHSMN